MCLGCGPATVTMRGLLVPVLRRAVIIARVARRCSAQRPNAGLRIRVLNRLVVAHLRTGCSFWLLCTQVSATYAARMD